MNREKIVRNESGFTLLEVLLSIVILGILLLFILSIFTNAFSYTKRNEDKTVAINVARNALMYIEKQSFIELREYFKPVLDDTPSVTKELSLLICAKEDGTYAYSYQNSANPVPSACKNISINDVDYEVTISSKPQSTNRNFHIPVIIEVNWQTNGENRMTRLEGHVKSEDLR